MTVSESASGVVLSGNGQASPLESESKESSTALSVAQSSSTKPADGTGQSEKNSLAITDHLLFGATGLEFNGAVPYDEWASAAPEFRRHWHLNKLRETCIQWAVGDWILHGELAYPGKWTQAYSDTGFEEGYLADLASMAKTYPPDQRVPGVSWSHHKTVRSLKEKERTRILKAAAAERWSRTRLKGWFDERSESIGRKAKKRAKPDPKQVDTCRKDRDVLSTKPDSEETQESNAARDGFTPVLTMEQFKAAQDMFLLEKQKREAAEARLRALTSQTEPDTRTVKERTQDAGKAVADKLREDREAREAEALQSRRVDARGAAGQTAGGLPMPLMPEPETVEEDEEDRALREEAVADEPRLNAILDAEDRQDLEAQAIAIHAREQGVDLHAECVSRADYDELSERMEAEVKQLTADLESRETEWQDACGELELAREGAVKMANELAAARANIRNLQSQLDAYVDSCARLTPAAKEHLQWLRERRAPVGGVLPDEDETLEWALERVVAKVKSDMGRKR